MSDDSMRGLQSGLRGDLLAPTSAEGVAGWMAGQNARHYKGEGSIEWLVAPFVLAPIFACLYPITTAATIATAFAAEALANAIGVANSSFVRFLIILVPTVVVCWTVGRRDQLWGLNRTYYIVRHVARLIIFAALINAATMNGRVPENARTVGAFFANITSSTSVMIAIALTLVFWQWLLMTAYNLRIYWNRKLISWFFRKKDFTPFYFSWKANPVIVPQGATPMPEFVARVVRAERAENRKE